MKIKPKGTPVMSPTKASPGKPSELRSWPEIAEFLGMPSATVYRWAKEGMPVGREGRNVVASPEALNQWLQRSSGEASGVHVITPDSDI
ncbi:MAG: helix-turn-helix domain-containing protein [Terriglobales bacterium]|jgi:predicted DNA-binding transcriptional regulator AlpA